MRGIIDGFGHVLREHLTYEIEIILKLKEFDGPVLKKAYLEFDLELREGDSVSASSRLVWISVLTYRQDNTLTHGVWDI